MKRTWMFAGAFAASSLLVGTGMLFESAHAEPQSSPSIRIAIVDVNKVFKGCQKFTRLMDGLKGKIETKENEMRATDQVIKGKIQALQQLKVPEDRDRLEKEIADLRFDFEKQRRALQEQFLREEADIYSACYKELTDLIKWYCEQNSIHVVLRDRDEQDTSPQAVLQTLNKQVVYHHPNLDLTQVMIDGLNQQQ